MAYYQHTLNEDSRGLKYLTQQRGIADHQSIKDFCAGYANGTLLGRSRGRPLVYYYIPSLRQNSFSCGIFLLSFFLA
jgi:hypothetical protein